MSRRTWTTYLYSIIRWIPVVVLVAGLLLIPVKPVHGMTGTGTIADPYIIYDVTDLQNISLDVTAYYELNNNIDASATVSWNGGLGFLEIANFSGNLDGNNYTISGICTRSAGFGTSPFNPGGAAGLFASINGGNVENVHLANVHIQGGGASGGFVQQAFGATTITNCSVQGIMYTQRAAASILSSGGFVGLAYSSAHISQCSAFMDIHMMCNSHYADAGGFIGHIYSTGVAPIIDNCYARGRAFQYTVQGALGDGSFGWAAGFHIYPGIGAPMGIIDDCYAAFEMDSSVNSRRGFSADNANLTTTNCFYDSTIANANYGGGDEATAQTTALMKTQSTFTNAGWDFTTPIWTMDEFNDGYPRIYGALPAGLVMFFDPNTYIEGDVLPDRGTYGNDGTFTWGANPGAVTVVIGSLISPYQPGLVTPDTGTRDVLPGDTPSDWFVDPDVTGSLLTNPFRPVVTFVSDHTTLNEIQTWRWFGIVFVLMMTVSAAALVPRHLAIACIAGATATITMVIMTIWPVWALAMLILYAFGGWVSERAPSL